MFNTLIINNNLIQDNNLAISILNYVRIHNNIPYDLNTLTIVENNTDLHIQFTQSQKHIAYLNPDKFQCHTIYHICKENILKNPNRVLLTEKVILGLLYIVHQGYNLNIEPKDLSIDLLLYITTIIQEHLQITTPQFELLFQITQLKLLLQSHHHPLTSLTNESDRKILLLKIISGFYTHPIFYVTLEHPLYLEQFVLFLTNNNTNNINITNNDGRTALICAISQGDIQAIELLINHGADINHQTNYQNTPLLQAISKKHKDIILLLLKNNVEITPKCIKLAKEVFPDVIEPMLLYLLNKSELEQKRFFNHLTCIEMYSDIYEYLAINFPKILQNAFKTDSFPRRHFSRIFFLVKGCDLIDTLKFDIFLFELNNALENKKQHKHTHSKITNEVKILYELLSQLKKQYLKSIQDNDGNLSEFKQASLNILNNHQPLLKTLFPIMPITTSTYTYFYKKLCQITILEEYVIIPRDF